MFEERERMVDIGIENPMLRSGIVLAGVNASLKEGKDDGLVSADKILGLWDTPEKDCKIEIFVSFRTERSGVKNLSCHEPREILAPSGSE
jgi:hypothetical protein